MKKSSEELKQELAEVQEEFYQLQKDYPWYVGKHLYLTPLTDEIIAQYRFYESRIKNLKININQAVIREFNQKAKNMKYEYRKVKCPWCSHTFMWNKNGKDGSSIHLYKLKETGKYVNEAKCPQCGEKMLVLDKILKGVNYPPPTLNA